MTVEPRQCDWCGDFIDPADWCLYCQSQTCEIHPKKYLHKNRRYCDSGCQAAAKKDRRDLRRQFGR